MKWIFVGLLLGSSVMPTALAENSGVLQMPRAEGPISLGIYAGQGQQIVSISSDGKVTFGPDYTPDTAARAFWEQIQRLHPEMCAPRH